MVEFHGWATIRYHTYDTDTDLQNQCWKKIEDHISSLPVPKMVHLQRYNGCDSLHIAGQHNHEAGYVIELFKWIAQDAPGSYGILYFQDDEDVKHENEFRVWRLCRGSLSENDDPFLSPYVPTVEDEHDESRGD
ncbi:MAG: Imm7 family immunity protein [Spirochaetales bacterium]|nr:Imm7 family immunity protein [Spirochaetales bacterium]